MTTCMVWQGKWLILGDFNEEPDDSWAQSLFEPMGASYVSLCNSTSTRWSGNRVIDHFYHNLRLDQASRRTSVLCTHLSDHKILELDLKLATSGSVDVLFKKQFGCRRPNWISVKRWQQIFQESHDHHRLRNWDEACALTAQDLPETQMDDQDQALVDFTWTLTMAKILTVFRTASCISLLEMGDEEWDLEEVRRVTHMANHIPTTQLGAPQQQQRQFPVCGKQESMYIRKLRNSLGKAEELRRLTSSTKKQADDSIVNLKRKLSEMWSDFSQQGIENLVQHLHTQLRHIEQQNKQSKLNQWRKNMQAIGNRGRWLHRSKVSYYPPIAKGEDDKTACKAEANDEIFLFWQRLHDRVQWKQGERATVAKEIGRFLQRRLKGYKTSKVRPSSKDFKIALSTSKGTPGLDQWSSDELKTIAGCNDLCEDVWQAMHIWEETGKTPHILQHCKVTYIPKAGKLNSQGAANPAKLRPIATYSIWWRTWSRTWIKSDMLSSLKSIFSLAMGSLTERSGSSKAAHCDSLLLSWKFGASLDFSRCFDCVETALIQQALQLGLPQQLHRWSNLACFQWQESARWITYDSNVCLKPIRSSVGIPQGDSASPLCLGLLLALGAHQVQSLADPSQNQWVHQLVYMDDRAIMTNSEALLNNAINTWNQFAERVHLLENPAKLQRVNLLDPSAEHTMEVLGSLIGLPAKHKFKLHDKHSTRLSKAMHTLKRVAMLPIRQKERLQSFNIFAKSQANYGWIAGTVPPPMQYKYDATMWKAAGRLGMSCPTLRSMLMGAAIELRASVFLSQIHTLANRRQLQAELAQQQLGWTKLDYMVHDELQALGWFEVSGTWNHEELTYTFTFDQICQQFTWKKIAHALRQSYRWTQWQKIPSLNRREFRDLRPDEFPRFSEQRLDLARLWAQQGKGSLALATGGCPSPGLRRKLWQDEWICAKCGEQNPYWDHYWQCCLDRQPPKVCLANLPERPSNLPAVPRGHALCHPGHLHTIDCYVTNAKVFATKKMGPKCFSFLSSYIPLSPCGNQHKH